MISSLLLCPKCKTPLTESVLNRPELTPCPACAVPLRVEIFPALFRRTAAGRDGEAVLVADEATCFITHKKKRCYPAKVVGGFCARCAIANCTASIFVPP